MNESMPEPPVNVKVHLQNGEIVPVDCVYVGKQDDIHEWEVVSDSFSGETVIRVSIDLLPAHTSVSLGL